MYIYTFRSNEHNKQLTGTMFYNNCKIRVQFTPQKTTLHNYINILHNYFNKGTYISNLTVFAFNMTIKPIPNFHALYTFIYRLEQLSEFQWLNERVLPAFLFQ